MNMNKIQIANYLSEMYTVDVVKVHTVIFQGKWRPQGQYVRKMKKRPDWKKAMVTITEPFSFPTFKEAGVGAHEGEQTYVPAE
jgi:ribosomal protein L23